MINLNLYNSAEGELQSISFDDKASIYTCGITPYDSSHLGHIATFLYFDVLTRFLQMNGVDVTLVRNVTDLDDPLFERVRTSGEDLQELVDRNVKQLDSDLDQLGCIAPTHEPYSSDYVEKIIQAINLLLDKGYAYTIDGWTYFDSTKRETFPELDVLKSIPKNELLEIAYDRGVDKSDARVKNEFDFVLWKPSEVDEPSFDTPFGKGRPGWHIECSVMAMDILGPTIDIHGGGDDLIFPHHACEVAQSETLSGKPFVRHFMHVAPVAYDGTKMSKSLGNLVYAKDVIVEIGARCTRLMLLAHHYREGFEHHDEDVSKSQERCATWGKVMGDYEGGSIPGSVYDAAFKAIQNDLDTPSAIAAIDNAVANYSGEDSERADIKAAEELLGL